MLRGVDVSSNQPQNILRLIDYDFAIVKASGNPQGLNWNYRNPYMNTQLKDAWERCGRVGVYHFTYGLQDATREAQFFLDTIGAWVDKAVLVIDYEGDGALRLGRLWVKKFAEYIEAKTGKRPVIYASGSVIIEQALKSLGYPLWVANYTKGWDKVNGYDTTGCSIYRGCEGSAMWQFTPSGYLEGYSGALDLNICYEDWNALLGKSKAEAMSKIDKMVDTAIRIAENNKHGYSMLSRWGAPDYDCSSLMYVCADVAGYPVGVGVDATRYTGTMLDDFTRVGFTAIPFRKVGLSGLIKGDILLNEIHHTEIYIGGGKFVGAHSNYDGKPGDSSGREISKVGAYNYDPEWDYVLRPPAETTTKKKVNDLQRVNNQGGDVYRLVKGNDHMWTTSKTERDALVKKGWKSEGVAFKAPKGGTEAIYRLAKGTDHLLTTSFSEATKAQEKGWTYEGVPFFGNAEGTPVYRLYKNVHLYTSSKRENDVLVKKGWKPEGVAFHV